jgi:hypothetical protein
VLYVRTAKSEAWICKDGAGALFYRGHNGQPGADLVEGVNAIFLTDVAATQYGYRARNISHNGTTEYRVSSSELSIRYPDGAQESQPTITTGY